MGGKTLQYIFHESGDLEILATHVHGVSGARLQLAALNDRCRASAPGARPYIVYWAAPWQKTITEYKAFPTLAGAQRCFKQRKALPPPVTPSLTRDFQREKVYQWEAKFIDRHSPKNITEEQMTRIAQKISDDFNMEAPSIRYLKNHRRTYSGYFPDDHNIDMVTRRLTDVIHETGHGVDTLINDNKWSGHGPSFVRTILRLADRYQVWLDPVKLEEEARKMGILITDEADLPPLPRY